MGPLTVHASQKRSKCERPRVKRVALRFKNGGTWLTNTDECAKGGSWFIANSVAWLLKVEPRVLTIQVLAHLYIHFIVPLTF